MALDVDAYAGLFLGQNLPGTDVWLGDGSIAVDDRTETSFVLAGEKANGSSDQVESRP